MADQRDDPVLVYLRRFDERPDRLIAKIEDLTGRASSREDQVVGLRSDCARLDHRIDRFGARVDRIEPRLNLVKA